MALKELSNEPKFVQIGSAISEKREPTDFRAILRLPHLYGYISGTGSRRHETFELDQFPN